MRRGAGTAGCADTGVAIATAIASAAGATRYNSRVTTFRPLDDRHALDALLTGPAALPVILFKHSQTCGISHMARESLAAGDLPVVVHEIVVQRQRDLSALVAARLGVRHESPQVLVVAGGTVTWHSSHAGVTAARVATAWHHAASAVTAVSSR